MFSIAERWNKQGDKAVVKDVTLKMINTDGKETALHKEESE
jgi:hypothetical protein